MHQMAHCVSETVLVCILYTLTSLPPKNIQTIKTMIFTLRDWRCGVAVAMRAVMEHQPNCLLLCHGLLKPMSRVVSPNRKHSRGCLLSEGKPQGMWSSLLNSSVTSPSKVWNQAFQTWHHDSWKACATAYQVQFNESQHNNKWRTLSQLQGTRFPASVYPGKGFVLRSVLTRVLLPSPSSDLVNNGIYLKKKTQTAIVIMPSGGEELTHTTTWDAMRWSFCVS